MAGARGGPDQPPKNKFGSMCHSAIGPSVFDPRISNVLNYKSVGSLLQCRLFARLFYVLDQCIRED